MSLACQVLVTKGRQDLDFFVFVAAADDGFDIVLLCNSENFSIH
jgi:hypothetical protein